MGNYDWNRRTIDYPKPFMYYTSGHVTVSGTDFDVKENSSLFDVFENINEILIRTGSSSVNVKFNSTDNDEIFIDSNDSFGVGNLMIRDIYVTVSGSTSLHFFCLGWS